MTKKWFFLFGLFLLNVASASAQIYGWTQSTNSPVTSRSDDIYFIDANTGWAVTGGAGGIFKTTNAGATWGLVFSRTGASLAHFRSVGFLSASNGFAGNLGTNSYDSNVKDTNILYATTDGGNNWNPVQSIAASGMKGFCAFHILDSQHIYGAGRVRGPAHFAKSENGGTNWTVTTITNSAGTPVMGGLMDVYFKDPANGFVVGMDTNTYASGAYHGSIAKTTNGGMSWTVVASTTHPLCYFWKMSWPSPTVGYVSLQQNGTMTNHIFYKTTDGGNTWVSNGIPLTTIGVTSFYWQGIGFVSTNEGWAGGDSATSPYANNFLHTVDGGSSWTRVGYNDSRRINRIRFMNPGFGYAAGASLQLYRLWLNFAAQPASQWATSGASVNFGITPEGVAPFSYQWKKNGINISNATNATLVLTNVARPHSGNYSVLVSNALTNLLSANATLRVLVPQKFQTPQSVGNKVKLLFGDADGGWLTTNELNDFEVQASTNLSQWLTLTNSFLLTNGLLLLEDEKNAPQKFYRVVDR